MVDCAYCDDEYDSESAYDEHLLAEHRDELGPIDTRRLGLTDSDDEGPSKVLWGGALAILLFFGGVLAFGLMTNDDGGDSSAPQLSQDHEITPTDLGSVHYHGSMEMVVLGDRVDFSQQQYQLEADPFHFERGNGERWHGHARQVTLAWGMDTLGIVVTEDSVTYNGTTYRDSDDGIAVSITVNGESVDPSEHVLSDGDSIRIIVEEE